MSARKNLYSRPFGFSLSHSGSEEDDGASDVNSDGASINTCVGELASLSDFDAGHSIIRDCTVARRNLYCNVKFDENPVTEILDPSEDVDDSIRVNALSGVWIRARMPVLKKFVRGAFADCRDRKTELDSFGYAYPFVEYHYSQTMKNCISNMRGFQHSRSARMLSGEVVVEPMRRRGCTCKRLTRTFVLPAEKASIKAEAAAYEEEVEW